MALQTNPNLNAQIIYELSVQNHTETHDFAGVIRDLDRIRDLGVDVVWLMPIHPRGEKMRFGVCGSPYSVKDFRAINPAYGTEADFDRLVREVHARGMKLMLDIVYNHTSQDSVLVQEHPEYFYQGADGKPMYRFWNDVYDLDYRNEDLCRYMVETALSWARSTSTWSPGRSPCPLPTASTRTCWAARSRSGAAARPRPCAPCCCT